MKKVFVLLFLFAICVFADNIHLKNGKVYLNVFVVNKTKYAVIFVFNGQKMSAPIDDILKIEELPIQPNVFPDSVSTVNDVKKAPNISLAKPTLFTNPNKNLIFLSILSGAIAWDYFSESSDIEDYIGKLKQLSYDLRTYVDTSELENSKKRKNVVGYISLAICVVSAIISFKAVDITATPTSISLSYSF